MKLIALLLITCLVGTFSEAAEPIVVSELPEFGTVAEWTQDLQNRYPSFELLYSGERSGIWLALFRTAENNLVWSEKRMGERLGSGSRSIRDGDGNSILLGEYDPANDRERPHTRLNFRTDFKIFHDNGWDVFSRDDGVLLGIVQPSPKEFRFLYRFKPRSGGGETIVFDERIRFLPE